MQKNKNGMDLPSIQCGRHTGVDGLWHNNLHSDRKFQGTDSDILIEYKLNSKDSQNWWYILDDILHKDFPNNSANMNMTQHCLVLYKRHLYRKVMACKDWQFRWQFLRENDCIDNLDNKTTLLNIEA